MSHNFNENMILVLEDDLLEQIKLKNMLLDLGDATVNCVATVEEAKKYIETEAPSLLIAEVFLKGETSVEFVGSLSIPTIFMTMSKERILYERIPEKHKYGMVVLNRTVFLCNFPHHGKSQQTNYSSSQVR